MTSKTVSAVELQKGNAVLIVLLLVALAAGGFYFYNTGKVNLNSTPVNTSTKNSYTLNSGSNEASESSPSSTSSKITLTVNSPLSGAVLQTKNVTVTGKTSPNAEVFINDRSTKADTNGNFSLAINLDEGENTLIINANDAEGNVAEQTITLNVSTL